MNWRLLSKAGVAGVLILGGMVTAEGQTATPNLDVLGIKLGMPAKTAEATVKAYNPKLTMAEQTLQLEGFDQVLLAGVQATTPGEAGKDTERIDLGITMPPSAQVVWGVRRTTGYARNNMPSLENVLAALHKKYGPENIPMDPDPRSLTKNMVWVLDAQGRSVAAGQARSLNANCNAKLSTAFEPSSANNEMQGFRWPAECDGVVLITASVQASTNAVPGSIVVYNLITQVASGPSYRTAIEATRKIVVAAVKAREDKQREEIAKRGPKV